MLLCLRLYWNKERRGRNGERKGTRAVLLGAKATGSGVGYGTKGPRTFRRCSPLDLTLAILLPSGQRFTSVERMLHSDRHESPTTLPESMLYI
ncbi:hypothetical protein L484_005310 [Morus notabilis]|uniref:Uncharacterized protein n=1 Tax=Morus notabilis TaxID=981085 RepID=W9R8V9_9ROSA|nr:hypothetical protein L484_005310 [Morus notabilis]